MKTLTDKLRALATTPEFEDTTTAKLFLEIADQAECLVEDKARLDWLEKRDAEIFSDEGYGDGLATWHCTVGHGNVNDRQYTCHPASSIREAIDAAIRAEK